MKYYFAPVQGHTDAAYRHFHAKQYGVAQSVIYTTPFIRLEKGEIRKKDLKDALSPLNDGLHVVPQVIFRDEGELSALVALLVSEGVSRIDINMGCPFPLQMSRGRGAAAIGNPSCVEAVKKVVEANPDVVFSVKMRLGNRENEWENLIKVLNSLRLDHISVHPRLGHEQYSGPVYMDEFDKIYDLSANPLVYNGDILTPEDARNIIQTYPNLHGVMIGRGALGRPSIFREIITGEEMEQAKRISEMKSFHRALFTYYSDTLIGGEHQVLAKILPFWEYAETEIGRKAWKAIKKASNMSKYQTALASV